MLAALFGAGNAMDAYLVAFRVPNLLRDLFAEGAMSSAIVPTFTERLTKHGRADAWRFGSGVLSALLLVTTVAAVAVFVYAGPIVRAFAGSFAAVPGKLDLTIRLTRIMLPFLPLVCAAAAMMGMLNSLHHHFIPAIAPAMFNVATIVAAFTLIPVMERIGQPAIAAIAIGTLLGGAGQVALQVPALRREGFRYRPRLAWGDGDVTRVLTLMGPGTFGLAATQVNLFVTTLMATAYGPGAVSWLTYAFRLIYLPIGLFGVSIATAVLPAVSEQAAAGNTDGVRATLTRGLMLMLVLNLPAAAGLIALSTPIVRLLFERGAFAPADTAATAAALSVYAVGLAGYSAARITGPVFYALGDGRVPALVSLASMAINIGGSLVLGSMFGFVGLALATSIAALANAAALIVILRRKLGYLGGAALTGTALKVLIASGVMAWTAIAVEQALVGWLPGDAVPRQSLRLFAAITAALLCLYLSARVLRIRELDELISTGTAPVRRLLKSVRVRLGRPNR